MPKAVGVPEMVPSGARASPSGRVPPTTVHARVPPLPPPCSTAEYDSETAPSGSEAVPIVTGTARRDSLCPLMTAPLTAAPRLSRVVSRLQRQHWRSQAGIVERALVVILTTPLTSATRNTSPSTKRPSFYVVAVLADVPSAVGPEAERVVDERHIRAFQRAWCRVPRRVDGRLGVNST